MLLVLTCRPDGWMDQDATWYGYTLSPGHIVLDADPALPPLKGAQQLPSFRPMSVVSKWLSISSTAEHLFYIFPAMVLAMFVQM